MVATEHVNIDEAYSTGQAARRLEISPQRVVQMADAGQLPYRRTALGRLFDAAAVDRLARARQQPGRLREAVRRE
jgi:excisionase family DNA binding protein